MSLASSRRSSGSSSSVTSDELGAPEQPGRGEGWQLPKPTNGERNVFGHINIGIGLLKKRLFAPQRLSEGPTIRRSDVRRSQALLWPPQPCRDQRPGWDLISHQPLCRGRRRTTDHFQQHCPTREDPGQKQTVMDVSFSFFLFSKENYIEMRFYL